jgi:hypothetical protein
MNNRASTQRADLTQETRPSALSIMGATEKRHSVELLIIVD